MTGKLLRTHIFMQFMQLECCIYFNEKYEPTSKIGRGKRSQHDMCGSRNFCQRGGGGGGGS